MRGRNREDGFTLVEVLVSLFIFSILASASLGVLANSIRAKTAIETHNQRLQALAITRILLRDDLNHTVNMAPSGPVGATRPARFRLGQMSDGVLLDFSRTGHDNPGGLERRSDLVHIRWLLQEHTLVRESSVRYNTPENTASIRQELLQDVDEINVQAFDGQLWRSEWITAEPPFGAPNLPSLVRLTFHTTDGRELEQIFAVEADQ